MSSNREIFDNDIFELPKKYDGNDFPTFLRTLFEEFQVEIGKFTGDLQVEINAKKNFINSQIQGINLSLKQYYAGFPALAFSEISKVLTALEKEKYLPIQTSGGSDKGAFYRMRLSGNDILGRKDLFHIPFQLRQKVSTQRYSIPGLPCLYLGDSVYVCWEELGRPDINAFHVSRFDLSETKYKLLYFNVSTSDVRKRCFSDRNVGGKLLNQLTTFLCYWPLLAACSVKVAKPNEIFKPEYVVSQLVLQWIVSSKSLDGILYKSNRVSLTSKNVGTFTNVVIPVKKSTPTGFCQELIKDIKLTNPLSWQILNLAGKEDKIKGPATISDLRRAMYIELIPGEKSNYSETKFGILEDKLKSARTENISN